MSDENCDTTIDLTDVVGWWKLYGSHVKRLTVVPQLPPLVTLYVWWKK